MDLIVLTSINGSQLRIAGGSRQLSKFGKMYQIYRLKSQNTYRDVVLLDAETRGHVELLLLQF